MNMGGIGTAPVVFSLIPAIRYFSWSWSKSTCHDQGQMKRKKRGRITQLLSKHGRLLVLEVSRPILTQNSRGLLSLVACKCLNRSISICCSNSFAKCANQTSRRVVFSLSPHQGKPRNTPIPTRTLRCCGFINRFSSFDHIAHWHVHAYHQIPKPIGAMHTSHTQTTPPCGMFCVRL